jgi:uncharacterized protein YecE (DUF72 family)
MLGYYGLRLRSVEIDVATLPAHDELPLWSSATPTDFVFVVRAPRRLTQLDGTERASHVRELWKQADLLGHKLGPVLFRCPPSVRKDIGWLDAFLETLPDGARAAFEFRSRSWYDDQVFAVLEKHGVALCVVDFDDASKVAPLVATARFGYFRMRAASYSDDQLEERAERIVAQPWHEAFVFFQHTDNTAAPKLALRMLECVEAAQPVIKPVAKAALPRPPPPPEALPALVKRSAQKPLAKAKRSSKKRFRWRNGSTA